MKQYVFTSNDSSLILDPITCSQIPHLHTPQIYKEWLYHQVFSTLLTYMSQGFASKHLQMKITYIMSNTYFFRNVKAQRNVCRLINQVVCGLNNFISKWLRQLSHFHHTSNFLYNGFVDSFSYTILLWGVR